jgi:hypothetical protein
MIHPEDWSDAVADFIATRKLFILSVVAREALGIRDEQMDRESWQRIAGILKKLGWKAFSIPGSSGKVWAPLQASLISRA